MAVELPQRIASAIYRTYDERRVPWIRMHIGGSDIGKKCDRQIWLGFHHAQTVEKIEPRKLRLFDTGHREEARVIDDLRRAGYQVWDRDPENPEKQISFTSLDGHMVVNLDGIMLGVYEAPDKPHVLEVKSMAAKYMNALEKSCVEKEHPKYWDQCQTAMGASGIDRCIFIAVCKDDDRIYEERIKFDPERYRVLMLRAQFIRDAETAPDRISRDPTWWECKLCPVLAMCHGSKIPEKNCRSCVHSSPGPAGTWTCGRDLPMVPTCGEHLYRPSMLDQWAEPIDGDETWIKYRKKDGTEFVNSAASGFPAMDVPTWGSEEMSKASALAIGNEAVERVREKLDGEVISATP